MACAGDEWHFDEIVLTIAGVKHWLWRAVDQSGHVLDILVQSRRDTADFDVGMLFRMMETVALPDVIKAAERLMEGKVRGHIVVPITAGSEG